MTKETSTTKKKVNLFEKELKAIVKVKEYKLICESNIVSILWKQQDLFFDYDLSLDQFTYNQWKVYYQIGYDIIIKEQKKSLDEITVNMYLEKHKKLKTEYDKYGGYEAIIKTNEYVEVENIEGYIKELSKWNAVLTLVKRKFPIADRLSEYVDMTSEQIYEEYECLLNDAFANTEGEGIRTYQLDYKIDDLINDLDKGMDIGLPYYHMDILNTTTNGLMVGNMYLLLASSGTGKSSFLRSLIFPSIIENDERLIIMINEEDIRKLQKEMIIWVANNIYKFDFQKIKLNSGNYSNEVKEMIYKCTKWIKNHNEQITVIVLDNYTTNKAIKIIKKYSALGYKYFLLDTFKYDSDSKADNKSWLELQQNSVKLYDTIKPSAKNVCLMCTMQLIKSSIKQRYLTLEAISGAKNVVDVVSGCYMLRWVLPDEYTDERNELKVYKYTGKDKKSKIPVRLSKNKHYQLVFFPKNRDGSSLDYCLVMEVDLSKNIYKEVGTCVVNPDW